MLWVFRQHDKMELLCCGRTQSQHNANYTVTQKCQLPENPQHNNLKLSCCDFHNTTVLSRQHNKMELLCCGRTHNTTQTTVTQKCQFRPESAQHNNLKLLCCGFSGRWHLWATVYIGLGHVAANTTQQQLPEC